jgi:hypothetical protein
VATLIAADPRQTRRRTALTAAAVYLVLRGVSAVVILLGQERQPRIGRLDHTPYFGMITHWDALWFQRIALTGYPHVLPLTPAGHVAQNPWAFYAGFPFVTRAVMQATDLTFPVAATFVVLASGVVAAVAMAKTLEARIPPEVTLGVVAVWAALPMSPALQLPYSEAPAMALLCLSLLWLQRRRWWPATLAAVLLGLTRPILLPLVPVYAVAVWLRWRSRGTDPIGRGERWSMFGGLATTTAAVGLWPAMAWWWTGQRDAYAQTQGAWSAHHALALFPGLARQLGRLVEGQGLPGVHLAALAAFAGCCLLGGIAIRSPRLDPVLATWCLTYAVFVIATTPAVHPSVFRILLPLYPLVAVVCGAASGRITGSWRVRCCVLIAAGIVGQYVWVTSTVAYIPGVTHAP